VSPIAAINDARDGIAVPLKGEKSGSAFSIEDSSLSVCRSGNEPTSVRTERYRLNWTAMVKNEQLPPCIGIPYPGGLVVTRRGDSCAVWVEGNSIDVASVTAKRRVFWRLVRTPNPDRAVSLPGCDVFSIVAECSRGNLVLSTSVGKQLFSRINVP